MEWYWAWCAFALAAGAFYSAYEADKRSKKLEKRIEELENKIR